ncbi:MAG: glucose-1-phosphate adenylyltransferase [Deltaproteobacteria bacterium]|nr:glucose-1-phosphate adenylyltransferase [Deltaproteobacteria bacterium]
MDVRGIILAGGNGERLYPLIKDRAKPAVPFGGKYRIIDFVLSNFVNSGIHSIYVLTQYKAQSLMGHLEHGWRLSDLLNDRFVTPVPAQMQTGREWYLGTADSVYQNLHLIQRHNPKLVAVFGADHIYRMNIRQMVEEHRAKKAEVTVAARPVKVEEASHFGVIEIDGDWRIVGFEEKPKRPKPIPGEQDDALASMGNYLFDTELLTQALTVDARNPASTHDFGRDLLPALLRERKTCAYDFRKNRIPGPLKGEEPSYWRDVGTIKAYYEASMDLRAINPSFNLYNQSWPIQTAGYSGPPAKFVFDEEQRRGVATNSIVGEGTIISGSLIRGSVIGRSVRIHSYCLIEDSIIMDWVEIGRGCQIRKAIIDKHNIIPPGTRIGFDAEEDRNRYFVSEGGIVVIPRGDSKTGWSQLSSQGINFFSAAK